MKIVIVDKKAYEAKVLRELKNGNLLITVIGIGNKEVKKDEILDVSSKRSFKDALYDDKAAFAEYLFCEGILDDDSTPEQVDSAWSEYKPMTELQYVNNILASFEADELDELLVSIPEFDKYYL